MHTPTLSAAVALICAAMAAPAPAPSTSGVSSFSINQVFAGYKLKNGLVEKLKTFSKFGVPAPADLVLAAEAVTLARYIPADSVLSARAISNGTVTATPADQYDSEYLEPVTIGNQMFKQDFDTGSSDLWVLGANLSSNGGGHTYYAPSSSAKQLAGETWSISYGDGSSASGTVFTDTVSIGMTSVVGQDVEYANKASSEFTSGPNDGLVGLAFDSINTCTSVKCPTFMDSAISRGLPAVFTAYLKHQKPGSYDFGYVNRTKYTGNLTYTPVDNSQGFWGVTPSGYAVGTGSTTSPGAATMAGIIDTGTTLIYAGDSVVSAYYSQVSGAYNNVLAGGYTFPCSSKLPNFTLVFGNYKAVVPGSFINYAPISSGSTTCYGGIQSDDSIGMAIYGDIFIKSQFVVFDRTQSTPRIGLAPQSGV